MNIIEVKQQMTFTQKQSIVWLSGGPQGGEFQF